MRREYFGPLGMALTDRELARLLIIAAEAIFELSLALRYGWETSALKDRLLQIGEQRSKNVGVRLHTSLDINIRSLRPVIAAQRLDPDGLIALRHALPPMWEALVHHAFPPYLINVCRLDEGDTELDRRWLVGMLTSDDRVLAAMVETQARAGRWSWPLQVGLPPNNAGRTLHEALQNARYRELYTPRLVGEETDYVDLLLIPDSLSSAQRLNRMANVKADTVLVLGKTRHRRGGMATRVLGSMMEQYSAGAAGVCFVPSDEQVPWVQTLIRELSHNQSLPAAAFIAKQPDQRAWEGGRNRALQAPLLLGDRGFVNSTPIAEAALRMAHALQDDAIASNPLKVEADFLPMSGDVDARPQTAEAFGRLLEQNVSSFQWLRESGDATAFVRLRQEIEAQIGSLGLEQPPSSKNAELPTSGYDDGGAAYSYAYGDGDYASAYELELPEEFEERQAPDLPEASPAPADWEKPEDRFVQAQFTPLFPVDANPVTHLAANTEYRLRVHIGARKGDDVITAEGPLDISSLPPSLMGHDLELVYCPLSPVVYNDGKTRILRPVRKIVHLPEHGDSSHADFSLCCGPDAFAFRARLIVTFLNRVLQTLLIHTEGEQAKVVMDDENRYADNLRVACAYEDEPVDIAFLVNDSPTGASGVTTLTGKDASFIEPPGLKASIDAIRTLLTQHNIKAVGTRSPKLDKPAIRKLLINLAHHGAELADELQEQHPNMDFAQASRVQVAEARDKAYLPVEFFYTGMAPRPDAELCPDAITLLKDPNFHSHCSHMSSDQYICPTSFWGFHKCIERLPSTEGGAHHFTMPQPGLDRLGPFDSALLAASDRANQQMTGPKGIPASVRQFIAKVGQATSWTHWTALVAQLAPKLMVLLPHSDNSPLLANVPAMEVSNDWLESPRVNVQHVKSPQSAAPGPLVLLLGCSTLLTDVEHMNFVHKFYRKGAPVVVGTLPIIHATQAALVACTLTQEIHTASDNSRFDHLLLGTKRRLLAQGREVALGLIAYGHSSWRL